MSYARIENGQIVEYPIAWGDLRLAHAKDSISERTPPPGYVKVADVARPDVDANVQPGPPEMVDGQWRRTWIVTDHPPETIARRFADRKRERWERVKERRDRIIDESFGAKTADAQARALELGAAIAAAADGKALQAIDIGAGWP